MFTSLTYTGSTPGADSNTYNLLNTHSSGWPSNWPAMFGAKKVAINIHHSAVGTIKWYKTMNDTPDTATWVQVGQTSVPAPASTDGSFVEFSVESLRHVKADWINGGSAQTTFAVGMSLTDERVGDDKQPAPLGPAIDKVTVIDVTTASAHVSLASEAIIADLNVGREITLKAEGDVWYRWSNATSGATVDETATSGSNRCGWIAAGERVDEVPPRGTQGIVVKAPVACRLRLWIGSEEANLWL